jgi:serine/threonine-protein phosphatase 6 regulatory ankyrin repeat subunit B
LNLDILEEIFNQKGELFNIRDKKGKTPLHFSVSTSYFEGTQFLLGKSLLEKSGKSFLERSTKGDLPIHIACKKGLVKIVKMLLLKQQLQEEPWNDLTECINAQGQNILHVAAKSGRNSVVKYILGQRNLNLDILLNSKDNDGNTALHLASMNLHPDVIVSLTRKKGVDVKLRNNKGLNAVDIVVKQGSKKSYRKVWPLSGNCIG